MDHIFWIIDYIFYIIFDMKEDVPIDERFSLLSKIGGSSTINQLSKKSQGHLNGKETTDMPQTSPRIVCPRGCLFVTCFSWVLQKPAIVESEGGPCGLPGAH